MAPDPLDDEMIGQEPPKKKRRVIDGDGNVVNSGGLPKPSLDATKNKKMRALILHLHEYYYVLFAFKDADLLNIDETIKVTGLLWTLYCLKKMECNDSGTIKTKVTASTTTTINEKEVNVYGQKDTFVNICALYGLAFTRNSQESLNMRGIFQSNFFLIYQFRYRCAEGLYQNNSYKIMDTGEEKNTYRLVEAWGVMSRHLGLTYGANFPPSMQSGMLQQMGPATLLIGLAETKNVKYQEKWINAVQTQMKLVPGINALAKKLAGSKQQYKEVITSILDIAAFGVAKQVHKASFCHAMLRTLITANADFKSWRSNIARGADGGKAVPGNSTLKAPEIGIMIPDAMLDLFYFTMDWSGKGMWKTLRHVSTCQFFLKSRGAEFKEVYSQWLSLSILGLWTEDMAVIEKVFGVVPIKRSKYSIAFEDRRLKGDLLPVKIMDPQYVCKLSSAAQTKLGATDQVVGIRTPVLSGKAVSNWKDDDERRVYLLPEEDGVQVTRGDTFAVARAKLAHHKARILTELEVAKKLSYGTTNWFRFPHEPVNGEEFIDDPNPVILRNEFIGID
nr:MAG: nucleoprotein [Wuhan Mosquito Virus 6]